MNNDKLRQTSTSQHQSFGANADKLRQQQTLHSTAILTAAKSASLPPNRKGAPPAGGLGRSSVKEADDVLQLEYNSVKLENDKLKNIITKLKQEIDVYSRLLQRQTGAARPAGALPQSSSIPLIESILVNSSKRRKKVTTVVARNMAHTNPSERILKDSHNDVMLGASSQLLPQQSRPTGAPKTDDLAPEDLLLMDRLTDVLKRME